MDRTTLPSPRRVVPVVLVAVLVLAPLMFALQVGRTEPRPRAVGVVGPVLVSQSVVDRAAALPGGRWDTVVLPETADPADAVRRGLLDATVEIDLRRSYDVLHVSSTVAPDVVAALRARASTLSSGYDRDLRVVRVSPARNPDAPRATPYLLVVAWIVLGVALAVGLSLRVGPVVASTRQSVLRALTLAGLSTVAALVVAAVLDLAVASTDVGLLRVTALGAVTVAATAWLVRGSEALFGLAGLGVAVSFVLGAVVPLLTLTGAAGLPAPWPDLVPWTVPGAALELARDDLFFGTTTGPRPVVVLVSWLVLALLTLGVAARDRPSAPRPAPTAAGSAVRRPAAPPPG